MNRILRHILFFRPRTAGYDADAEAYFARFDVAADATRKGHLNTLILALKAAGTWTKRDAYYCIAAHDAQAAQRNMKADEYNLTLVSTPTFVTDRGYKGNAGNQALDTNHNGSTPPLYTQSDCSIFTWLTETASDVASGTEAAVGRTTSVVSFIRPRGTSDLLQGRMQGPTTQTYGSATTRLGSRCLSRAGTTVTGYVNGVLTGTQTSTASALAAENIILLKLQSVYSDDTIGAAAIGAGVTEAEAAAEHAAFNTYLTAIGAV